MNAKNMIEWAEHFLNIRRDFGFKIAGTDKLLMNFANYIEQNGNGVLTNELALKWARLTNKNTARTYWCRRLEIVRSFARFLIVFVPETEIPPVGIFGRSHSRKSPHIYTSEELVKLFTSCESLLTKNGLRPQTYKTLLGLLLSTGLRISEALKLNHDDVDFEKGLLLIRETKFYKSRLVPLHLTTVQALKEYASMRDRVCGAEKAPSFFLSDKGESLLYSTVNQAFRKLCDSNGLKNNNKNRPRPRFYDFRHTFACRVLIRWQNKNANIEQLLPALSTYLGHASITDTYWYLTGIPELLATAGEKFEQFAPISTCEDNHHEQL